MPKQSISFAKIVSPPSATAWAQTYHAGNVYAVVGVKEIGKEHDPEHALPSVLVTGKDVINNLEAEYFAIAEKNLHSIKEAVQNACKDIPETIEATVLFVVLHDQTLYLFAYGNGQIFMKRQQKFGTLLESHAASKQVTAASGKIETGDVVTIATQEFLSVLPPKEVLASLAHPVSELEERLTALIDDEKHAGAAALIFCFEGTIETVSTEANPHRQEPIMVHEAAKKLVTHPTPAINEPKLDLDQDTPLENEQEQPKGERQKNHRSLPRFKLSRRQ